jgi:tetratricopeptide (TPR) repeat protein
MKPSRWLPLLLLIACQAQGGDLLDQAAEAKQSYDAGRWEEALERYGRLAEEAPGNAEIRFRLGNVYARLGRLDEAAASYQDLLSRHAAYPKGWHNLAVVRIRQAMAALSEAGRQDVGEALPSRRLLDALEYALGGGGGQPAVEYAPAPPPAAATPLTAFTAARTNLRQGRGAGHAKVAVLPADAPVEVLARQEGYAQVKTKDGQTGWLPLYLLRLGPEGEGKHAP